MAPNDNIPNKTKLSFSTRQVKQNKRGYFRWFKNEPTVITEGDVIRTYPDGGWGWLVCLGMFLINLVSWGTSLSLSVYLQHYMSSEQYNGKVPSAVISLITGSSLSLTLLASPFSNYVENHLGVRKCIFVGVALQSAGLGLASLSSSIWSIIIFQSILAGIGRGLMTMPVSYIISQWFHKHCTMVNGLCHAGSGLGGIILGYTTEVSIANYGIKNSFHIINAICTIIAIPALMCVTTRHDRYNIHTGEPVVARQSKAMDISMLKNKLIILLCIRSLLSHWAYTNVRSFNPTYAREVLELSSSDSSLTQSMFSAGLLVGRPILGIITDRIGVVKAVIYIELVTLLAYYIFLLPARSMTMISIFAFIEGIFAGGVLLTTISLLVIIGKGKMVRENITIVWIVCAIASLASTPSFFGIVDGARASGASFKTAYKYAVVFNTILVLLSAIIAFVIKVLISRENNSEIKIKESDEEIRQAETIVEAIQ